MWKLVAFLAPAAALAACVVSASPVVEEQDAEYDPRLEGEREEVQGSDRAVIVRGPGRSYVIEYSADQATGRFTGRLGRLGGRLVLDVQPQPRGAELPGPYEHLLIPGHLLLVVDVETSDEMRLSTGDPDVLLAALEAGGFPMPYDTTESQLILQASTEELRSALAAHMESPDALEPQGTWQRVPAADAPRRPVDVPCFEAAAWREADALFRGDPYWRGAGVASSVELGAGRTLWLFGDTWIHPTGRGTRAGGGDGQQQRRGPDRSRPLHRVDRLPLGPGAGRRARGLVPGSRRRAPLVRERHAGRGPPGSVHGTDPARSRPRVRARRLDGVPGGQSG